MDPNFDLKTIHDDVQEFLLVLYKSYNMITVALMIRSV